MTKKNKPKKKKTEKKLRKMLPLIPTKKDIVSAEFVDILMKVFDEDEKLVSFYMAWIKHEGNSTKAYKELHPSVSDQVASVLGARRLAKVREKGGLNMLLCDFGLGLDIYLQKIKDGLNAVDENYINIKLKTEKGKPPEVIYEKVTTPNHSVQKVYHDKLGKLLGIEDKKDDLAPNISVQVNNLISEKKDKYGI